MIGILKDEDEFYIEFHPYKPKWRVRIPCRCQYFGEYGISFEKWGYTIYWYNTGYPNMMWAIRDFRKFIKRTISEN